MKRETESGLQWQLRIKSIKTNLVKARIDKSQGDSLSRMCRKVQESIDPTVVIVVNLHRRSTREGMIAWEK